MVDLQSAALSLLPWYLRWPLKLLGWIGGAISAAAQWMWRHPWQSLAAAALLAFSWAWHGWGVAERRGRQQQQLAQHWKIKFVDQRAEMRKIPGILTAKYRDAARLDRDNAARVKREQHAQIERITHELQQDHAAALADLRQRLRGDGTAGGASVRCEGGGGAADVPVISALSEGAGGALRAGGLAIVDERDAMICTANSLRLQKLIKAWDGASSVDVNAQDLPPLTE
jgi:hypothetical protein